MKVKISELRTLAAKALRKYGNNDSETKTILEILMYAQLRGNNQGLVKLIGNGLPKNPKAGKILVKEKTKLSALINGSKNPGMVVMTMAMNLALQKAKKYGFGIVGTNNTSTSTGALGFYAKKIAEKGFLGFVFAGSPETVSTHGSYQPIFGTNPLAVGIPSDKSPIVLDMATAAMAYYGLIEAKTAGKSIPEGIAYDKNGKITTDPAKAMDGALRPFDKSYKSAGLSLIVEILTGPLIGATFVGIGDYSNWGNLIFVIDPELMTTRGLFKKQVSQLTKVVKSTKKLPGVKEIFMPGERGEKLTEKRLKSGEIEIETNLYNKLKEVALK